MTDDSLPGGTIAGTLAAIRPPDEAAAAAARERQARLTKPPGSLGFLEELSVRLAAIAGQCPPPLPAPAAVAVFAADHGVHAQGVTPWPQEVTAQMVANFLAGTAVVNAIAGQAGAAVQVVDVGVAAELPAPGASGPGETAPGQTAVPGLLARKVRYGTADMTEAAAMSPGEARRAVEVGIGVARDLVAAGHRCLLTGDMGIANTTASAALVAAFTGADPAEVTGRGTGIDDQVMARKVDVVRRALARHQPDPADPLGVLAAVGGLEHAALAGFLLGAAALRVPVLLDGVIACAAALAAAAFSPDAVGYMIAGHRSSEPGASRALAALGLRPVLDLDLRLGEGSGAALALPLLQAAARVLRDVATFDSAGVSSGPAGAAPAADPALDPAPAADPALASDPAPAAETAPASEAAQASETAPASEAAQASETAPAESAGPADRPRDPVAPVSAAVALARVAARAGAAFSGTAFSGTAFSGTAPGGAAGPVGARAGRGRVLVLGGARSGKSTAAEAFVAAHEQAAAVPVSGHAAGQGADQSAADPVAVQYVATGTPPDERDAEWAARVAGHRARRPAHWRTTETLDLEQVLAAGDSAPVLIDCLSLWLARVMDECGAWDEDGDAGAAGTAWAAVAAESAVAARVDGLIAAWRSTTRDVVAVSNEVGCGVVPATASGRRYRDALGRLNALVAADSDEVWFCTAGLPRRLK